MSDETLLFWGGLVLGFFSSGNIICLLTNDRPRGLACEPTKIGIKMSKATNFDVSTQKVSAESVNMWINSAIVHAAAILRDNQSCKMHVSPICGAILVLFVRQLYCNEKVEIGRKNADNIGEYDIKLKYQLPERYFVISRASLCAAFCGRSLVKLSSVVFSSKNDFLIGSTSVVYLNLIN